MCESLREIIHPRQARNWCHVYKYTFIGFTCVQWVLLSRLGKQPRCAAPPSRREIKNKAETGGLDLKTSFPCQSVKEGGCQSALQIQIFCRCCFKAFFSGYVLGAACFAIASFVADHCHQCLLSVKCILTTGTSLQSSKATAGVMAKPCHIYFMLWWFVFQQFLLEALPSSICKCHPVSNNCAAEDAASTLCHWMTARLQIVIYRGINTPTVTLCVWKLACTRRFSFSNSSKAHSTWQLNCFT